MSAPSSKQSSAWIIVAVVGAAFVFLAIVGVAGVVGFQRLRSERNGVAVVDEAYRFQLSPPGEGWRIFGGDEASSLVPGARAGAVHKDGRFAAITVEAAPGVELAGYADLLRSAMQIDDAEVVYSREETVAGVLAIREGIRGTVSGHQVRFDRTVLVAKDHGYQLLAWGGAVKTDAEGDFARPIRSAFSLLAGEVKRDTRPAVVKVDQDGADFRVRDGLWESAGARLRLKSPPASGWRPATRLERTQMDQEADLAFVHTAPDVYLAIRVQPAAAMNALEVEAQDAEAFAEERGWTAVLDGKTQTVEALGLRFVFKPYVLAGGFPMDVRIGSACDEGRCLRIWYWTAQRAEGEERLVQALLANAERLSELDAKALRMALEQTPDPDHGYMADASLRQGVFHSFTNGVRWKKPHRGWAAELPATGGLLTVQLREAGIRGTLSKQESIDQAELHAFIVHEWGIPARGRPEVLQVEGREVWISELVDPLTGVMVASTIHDEAGYVFEFYGRPEHLEAARPQLLEALRGLSFVKPMPAVSEDAARFTDRRLGYSFTAPDSRWVRKAITVEGMSETTSASEWRAGSSNIQVVAIPIPVFANDVEFLQNTVLENVARKLSPGFTTRGAVVTARFAGRDVRAVRSKSLVHGFELYSFVEEGRLFTVSAYAKGPGATAPVQELEQGFELLDP